MKHTTSLLTALLALLLVACGETPDADAENADTHDTPEADVETGEADVADARAAVSSNSRPRNAADAPAGVAQATDKLPAPPDVAAAPADAAVTESGLAYKVLQQGTGADHPAADGTVKVHYTGWTTDGEMFDSSVVRGEPTSFPLNRVIPGWTEGVQLMVEGEKTRFWIPAELAYGDPPKRPGAPAGMLVFDIELLEIDKPIPAPADVAAPPADATVTESGLAYKVLTPGSGGPSPTPTTRVHVHYTGWTTDGKMFDSSVKRGEPAIFPLNAVIPGWTEGLQTMTVGGTTRFWIPAELAYGDPPKRPGAPAGMLVFDVELLTME